MYPSSLTLGTVGFILLITLPWLYFRLLPKPIPGIPYNASSAKKLLGDIPDAIKFRRRTGELWSFIRSRCLELNSPIFQLFMTGPGGKPWVILTDFRESHDIQTHRQGEFDRSSFLGEVFGPLIPGNHVWMPSDERFYANRNLIRDTMSPAFLHDVVVPILHSKTRDLLDLWAEKTRLSQEQPFQVDQDIIRSVVDMILLASLGTRTDLSKIQTDVLRTLSQPKPPIDLDTPIIFPKAKESKLYSAVRTLVDSIAIGMSSPMPRLHMTFALRFYPSLARARRYTNTLMSGVLERAWSNFYDINNSYDMQNIVSAADLIVRREAHLAQKQNRAVIRDYPAIRDELMGFYIAGHETTSSTICWAVKYLTQNQKVQYKLRSALQSAFQSAYEQKRLPTADEIVKSNIPYLDAFIEENHRLGNAIPATIRRTTRDTIILGHKIPKETDVFMMSNGPGYQLAALPVNERQRSLTSQHSRERYGIWNPDDVTLFEPERFLKTDQEGKTKFDPYSGPVLPYGAGLRGCFGIRLGMLELKVIITMIVWTFELQQVPIELSSFKAHDLNTHRPDQMYLRLRTLN
ncbi:cytochrome P450 [Corynespora cassiicola Philippines]|uniref:Cytochrome P450 n=1 Tax=Corynespora cassiicola Philippines TaxID=1448308 RepID=A0A2T2N425_CORCC|nr:cytochrome P450 [Corynespora cassiicola Philippines]